MKGGMVVALGLLVAMMVASGEAQAVLARKAFVSDPIVAEEDNVVQVVVINVGDEPVYFVEVDDDTWGEGWTVTSGKTKATFEQLNPGGNVTHEYTVRAEKSLGFVNIPPAKVSYLEDAQDGEDDVEEVTSSSLQRLPVHPVTYYSRARYMTPVHWGTFLGLSAAAVVPSFLSWYYYQSSYVNGLPKSIAKAKSN
mmetsp:Transcript_28433/g.79484  ORF Transcript_28433/g.79484 Transcript_28433/m.79484 type:complete len:195 (-) Transcript_28433:178-762(-)|eukprot:CAMPEP_0119128498 /NCGR_PEP_ID=MMETSP1310-20130426/6629_1 /TAXON_ID=464262 /ORGANISM="Genus nov. species nov., Strain RCC2339" /LENGTH=194 /DNA_ID=CAMNT_0007118843 /DNA_START=57 /DNA_END=641 /DNA_ORIENTATION=+